MLILALYHFRRRRPQTLSYSSIHATVALRKTPRDRLLHSPFILRLLAIGCVVVGLARPVLGLQRESNPTQGIAIEMAMDRSGSVVARNGDAPSYDASFHLHAGTGFTLLSKRPEWYHIILSNGKATWIPASSARLVRPVASG